VIRTIRDFLNRVLGRGTASPPPRPAARPSTARQAVEGGIRIEYHGAAAKPAAKPASVSWHRERQGMPRFGFDAWKRRPTKRQRILIVFAAVSLVAEAVFVASRIFVNRRLPSETYGVWATTSPGYAGRLFELQARRVAFMTGDSTAPVTVFEIRRVRRSPVENGERFTVEYDGGTGAQQFRFTFSAEPRMTIRFVNQPRMVWERVNTTLSLIPGL